MEEERERDTEGGEKRERYRALILFTLAADLDATTHVDQGKGRGHHLAIYQPP